MSLSFLPSPVSHQLLRTWLLIVFVTLGCLFVFAPTTYAQTPTSYGALADLLEDADSRQQLIAELRRLSQDIPVDETADKATEQETHAAQHTSIAPSLVAAVNTGIAQHLVRFADQIRSDIAASYHLLHRLVTGQRVPGVSLERWQSALENLAIAFLAVAAAYLALRVLANRLFSRLDKRLLHASTSARAAPTRKSNRWVAAFLALVIDVSASVVAGLVGYACVAIFAGKNQLAALFAVQFLTAFVLVEALKALSRGVFAVRYEQLRLLPISADTAKFWHRWFSIILSTTAYGLLVVVPIAQSIMTYAFAQLLWLILMTAVYLYAVTVVWHQRHNVRNGLITFAERTNTTVFGTLIRVLARVWHWAVIVYLSILLWTSQMDQQGALGFMGKATVQSLIAIVVGAALIAALSSLASRPLVLPQHWQRSLPALQMRLNAYIPAVFKGVRLFIIIASSLLVLDAWHALNLAHWLTSPSGQAAIAVVIHVGVILLIAAVGWTILASMIEHRVGMSGRPKGPTEREKTLLMLLRNAAAVTIVTLTVLVVLAQIGIDIGPLIAGAGVAGLAIGFGAQKLVQDVITGIFIQLENGMNQNDVVEIVGLFGTVEKITIRSVVIRTLDGGYHLVPFSAIDKLANHTRDYGYHYAEYRIAHRESVDDAIAQLQAAFNTLKQDPEIAPEILEDIAIPGVTSLNELGFTIRVMIKTTPGNQWAVQRAFNRLVKEYFDANNIELPYPQTVVHFGRDKQGHAAPVDIRHVSQLDERFRTQAPGQTRRPVSGDTDVEPTPITES